MTRDELRRAGERMRARLGQPAFADGCLGHEDSAPGFAQMMSEAVYGGVWSRPGLALEERMVCTLAVLGLAPPSPQLDSLLTAALELGLAPRTILEIFVHCGLYGGFVTSEAACARAHEVFRAADVALPDEAPSTQSLEALLASGRELMQRLHGPRAGSGYAAPGDPITGELYDLAIRYGYGELWSRPGLDWRQRLLCALGAFTALGLEGQLCKFALAAMHNGFERQAVIEAIIQTAPYSGFPRALNALGALSRVLADPPRG